MISKHLLIHTCTVQPVHDTDTNGNPLYDTPPVILSYVRITPVYRTQAASSAEEKNDVLTLFIDGKHTVPHGYMPKELDKVIWQGKTYTVRTVTPCYTCDTDSIHHVKVGLV